MPGDLRDVFHDDLVAVQEAIINGVTTKTSRSKDAHWKIWIDFCIEIGIDPFLRQFSDPLPFLQVFAHRYREGRIAPSGRRVTANWVSNVLLSVGQKFKRMGAPDPRLSKFDGKFDYRLVQQLRGWRKGDAPPTRVRPVPITLVTFLLNSAHINAVTSPAVKAYADITCLAFFFLLRPGEYTGTTSDEAAFSLDDIHLSLGSRQLNLATASTHEIESATSVGLYFTTQKNQRKGDKISHGQSFHPLCCPVKAAIRLVLTHRAHFHATNTPFDGTVIFASYYRTGKRIRVRATDITTNLRFAASSCQHSTGIKPSDVSARSLRAGGAMALLCGRCDRDIIKLVGRWHSDAMMRYLHQDAQPIMQQLAVKMFNHGTYSFNPSATVPIFQAGPDASADADVGPVAVAGADAVLGADAAVGADAGAAVAAAGPVAPTTLRRSTRDIHIPTRYPETDPNIERVLQKHTSQAVDQSQNTSPPVPR